MGLNTQIIIPSSGTVDLYDDFGFALTYNIADIKDPQKRHADYSKTISIPGTNNNNKLFSHIYEIGVDRHFNPNHKAKVVVQCGSATVMKGYMQLLNINILDHKKIEYEIVITGRLSDIFTALGDTKLKDISWADLNHSLTQANQIASWSSTVGQNYVYPFIDYGYGQNDFEYEVSWFRPAIYFKEIIDRIFSYVGFQYSSSFLTGNFFKRLIYPTVTDSLRLTASTISNNTCRASRETSVTTVSVTDGNVYNSTTIVFNDDSTSPNNDAGGIYDTGSGVLTIAKNGYYKIIGNVNVQKGAGGTAVAYIDVRYVTGGTSIATSSIKLFAITNEVGNLNFSSPYIYLYASQPIALTIYYKLTNSFQAGTTLSVLTGSSFTLQISPSAFEGDTIDISSIFPPELKARDWLMSTIKAFNLYTEYDKDTENKILIEPRNDFYNATVQDWTQKLDYTKDIEVRPMGALDAKQYIFTYKKDGDYLNELYEKTYEETYGRKKIDVDNDFVKEVRKEELIFSPTPQYSTSAYYSNVTPTSNNDRYYPKIFTYTNGQVSPKNGNPRMLYYGGVKQCKPWNYIKRAGVTSFPFFSTSGVTNYPYCGHLDDSITPTLDLNFGVPKEVYYIPAPSATYSNNNLYNVYWKQMIDEVTDKNSSIVTAWFHLTPLDIQMVDFRNIYRFDFQNFRLNKIYDYDPVHPGIVKCEFIKMKTGVPFVSASANNTGSSDGVMGTETVPTVIPENTQMMPANRNMIQGVGNAVAQSAINCMVIGNYNVIGEGAQNVSIFNSSGCTVAGNLSNVIIRNSSGVTVTESNIAYERNQIVSNANGRTKSINANDTTDNGETIVLVDAGGAAVAYQLPLASSFPGRIISIKKVDSSANVVTIDTTGGNTIDGAGTSTLTTQWQTKMLISNGSNWFIT